MQTCGPKKTNKNREKGARGKCVNLPSAANVFRTGPGGPFETLVDPGASSVRPLYTEALKLSGDGVLMSHVRSQNHKPC